VGKKDKIRESSLKQLVLRPKVCSQRISRDSGGKSGSQGGGVPRPRKDANHRSRWGSSGGFISLKTNKNIGQKKKKGLKSTSLHDDKRTREGKERGLDKENELIPKRGERKKDEGSNSLLESLINL